MLDCWERGRNYPPEFFCQIHGDNSSHDTPDCIVVRKEFVMLYPDVATKDARWVRWSPCSGRSEPASTDS